MKNQILHSCNILNFTFVWILKGHEREVFSHYDLRLEIRLHDHHKLYVLSHYRSFFYQIHARNENNVDTPLGSPIMPGKTDVHPLSNINCCNPYPWEFNCKIHLFFCFFNLDLLLKRLVKMPYKSATLNHIFLQIRIWTRLYLFGFYHLTRRDPDIHWNQWAEVGDLDAMIIHVTSNKTLAGNIYL